MVVKDSGFGNGANIAIAQIHRRFRHDVEQGFDLTRADAVLMTNGLADVGVPDTEVAGVGAGKNLANEFSPRRHSQIERRDRIPQHIDAKRDANFAHQLPDNSRHCRRGFRANLREIGKTKLVGKHHGIHAAIL